MIRVGIIGGAGYTAGELIRLLVNHPQAEIAFVHSTSNAGNRLAQVHGGLEGDTGMRFCDAYDLGAIDVLFLCSAHGQSRVWMEENTIPAGVKIIDLAQDYYYPPEKKTIKKEEVDLVSRLMFMQVLHKTYAGTATVCTGVAAKIPGTIVNQVIGKENPEELVRIGHPAGVINCYSEVTPDLTVKKAAIERTARRLMEGYALLEKSKDPRKK